MNSMPGRTQSFLVVNCMHAVDCCYRDCCRCFLMPRPLHPSISSVVPKRLPCGQLHRRCNGCVVCLVTVVCCWLQPHMALCVVWCGTYLTRLTLHGLYNSSLPHDVPACCTTVLHPWKLPLYHVSVLLCVSNAVAQGLRTHGAAALG